MISGGFKNMNADQIIQCILCAMLKLEKSIGGIVEDQIVDGVIDKAPSQNIVYDAITNLLEIISNLNSNDIGNSSNVPGTNLTDALNYLLSVAGLPAQLDLEANGIDNYIDIGTTLRAKSFFYESVLQEKKYWSQTGSVITFTFTPVAAMPGTSNLQFI